MSTGDRDTEMGLESLELQVRGPRWGLGAYHCAHISPGGVQDSGSPESVILGGGEEG